MSDTGAVTQEVTPESPSATETEQPAAAAPAASPYEGLPDAFQWMVKELETTRREAAAARVTARETADKYKDAKTPEEFEALRAELVSKAEAAERAAALAAAARKHSLSDELTEFLTGSTPEEIEAQAAKLAAIAAPAAAPVITKLPPSGGTKPTEDAGEMDGRAAYRAWKKRR